MRPTDHQAHGGGPEDTREPKGDAESSQRHPPHRTEAEKERGSAGSGPGLPANAHGEDDVPADEVDQPIREESMYDQRRDEDKDRPPSARS